MSSVSEEMPAVAKVGERFEPDIVAAHLAARRTQSQMLRVIAVFAVTLTGSLVYLVNRPASFPVEWTAYAFRV